MCGAKSEPSDAIQWFQEIDLNIMNCVILRAQQ